MASRSTKSALGHERYILQSLRRIIRAVDLHSRRLKAQHDLTTPQLICLLAIVEKGPLTVTLISREMHLSASTIIGVLDRLEQKGLVERRRDTTDRRVVNVSATGIGRRLAATAPSPLQDNLAAGLTRLSDPQKVAIARSLNKVVELMEAGDIDAAPILETGGIVD